jgi:hypothetical protein
MGNFSSVTGTVTLVMMLLGRSIFAKFGWRIAALVTPAVSNSIQQLIVGPYCNRKSNTDFVSFSDDRGYWIVLFFSYHVYRLLCSDHGCSGHDSFDVSCICRRCPEYFEQEFKVFVIRPLQGDGLYSARSGIQDKGQGRR